jgi:hypothetical protein
MRPSQTWWRHVVLVRNYVPEERTDGEESLLQRYLHFISYVLEWSYSSHAASSLNVTIILPYWTMNIRCDVFTAAAMKNSLFWEKMTPCNSRKNRCVGGAYRLHFHSSETSVITRITLYHISDSIIRCLLCSHSNADKSTDELSGKTFSVTSASIMYKEDTALNIYVQQQ